MRVVIHLRRGRRSGATTRPTALLAARLTAGAMALVAGCAAVGDDIDRARAVYVATFDDPCVLADWRLEGGRRIAVEAGRLVLESDTTSLRSEARGNHLVAWLDREIPADFCLEFSVRPQNRRRGLNIVFFSTRGRSGRSIFDPSLTPRDGTFRQYHSGDLDGYHVSYWAGDRGSSHLRKNHGFHLLAEGPDLVADAPPDSFQRVRLYKRGGLIRLSVDGRIALEHQDDGSVGGPPHTHAGWIGLRQMAHTHRCEYDDLAVYPLRVR